MIDKFNEREEEILIIFGRNIQKAREAKKISRQELATLANYDRVCLSNLERGIQNIKFNTSIKLAKSLDVSFPALFSRNYMSPLAEPDMQIDIGFKEDEYIAVFTENFKTTLKEQKKNQLNVYIETGISEAIVSRVTNGKNTNPTLITLNAMSYVTGKDLYSLFIRNR